jgi:hypothetical protein
MTKQIYVLEQNPTQVEKVYYLEKIFELYANFSTFNKLIKKFYNNVNEQYFNDIKYLLSQYIDFEKLNSNNKVNIYLINNQTGKIILSNIDNVFSTYSNYINNQTYFYNLAEEQQFLNEQYELETNGKVGVNLLETPILNVAVNIIQNIQQYPLGLLYFIVGQKNVCPGYDLVAFVYTLSVI